MLSDCLGRESERRWLFAARDRISETLFRSDAEVLRIEARQLAALTLVRKDLVKMGPQGAKMELLHFSE